MRGKPRWYSRFPPDCQVWLERNAAGAMPDNAVLIEMQLYVELAEKKTFQAI